MTTIKTCPHCNSEHCLGCIDSNQYKTGMSCNEGLSIHKLVKEKTFLAVVEKCAHLQIEIQSERHKNIQTYREIVRLKAELYDLTRLKESQTNKIIELSNEVFLLKGRTTT